MFVCLNNFVMKVVSLPVYVNTAQDCVAGFLCGCGGVCELVFFGGRIRKELLCRMLWMVFSSCQYSAGCTW